MTQTESFHVKLPDEIQHSALFHLLANSLVLSHTAPYLSCYDVLNLAATSRSFRALIYQRTPQVFRRLDLGSVKIAQFDVEGIDRGGETWRNVQLDENLTEDDFYSGPLRGIFSQLRRADILRDVQVLSLDGLSVTAELIHDILVDPSFSVRILSIRGAKNLNERKLRGALQYACRDSRPEGTPRLKGLYIFGPKEQSNLASLPGSAASSPSPGSSPAAVGSSWNDRSQKALEAAWHAKPEPWYVRRGEQFPRRINPEWASTLVACHGIIAFDSVLCTGPRHINSSAWGSVSIEALNAAGSPALAGIPFYSVATHSLGGCASCGSAPEGWTVWGETKMAERDEHDRRTSRSGSDEIGRFPLLAPPPMHSATLSAAMCPSGQSVRSRVTQTFPGKQPKARFIPRCFDCLRDRYCGGCLRWWCESCYLGPFAPRPSGFEAETAAADPVSDSLVTHSNANPSTRESMRKIRVIRDCWECGSNCRDCIQLTQRRCRGCGGGYCLIHNEGSNSVVCDWCSRGGRHVRELY